MESNNEIHSFIHSFNPGEIFNVRAYYFITPWRICDLAKLIPFYFDFNGTILNCQITITLFVCIRVKVYEVYCKLNKIQVNLIWILV